MRIEVEKLTPQGELFAHTYAEGELAIDGAEDARLAGDTSIEGRASLKGNEIVLSGRIRAMVEAECDRCLGPIRLPLEIEFAESFAPADNAQVHSDETELKPADLHLSIFEGEEIDIDDLVREQVLLGLPRQFLCREDCKGLCPTCGANLNEGECSCPRGETDPRWAALANLKIRDG